MPKVSQRGQGPKVSYKTKIVLAFTLGIVIPGLALAYLAAQSLRYRDIAVKDILRENGFNATLLLINEIESRMIELERGIMGELIAETSLYVEGKPLEDSLLQLIGRHRELEGLYILDEHLGLLYGIDRSGLTRKASLPSQEGPEGNEGEFQEWTLGRIKLDLRQAIRHESGLHHISERLNRHFLQIAYLPLFLAEGGGLRGLLAFSLDMDDLRERVIQKSLDDFNEGQAQVEGLQRESNLKLVLLDQFNHPLDGDSDDISGRPILEVPFERLFTFWKIGVYPKTDSLPLASGREIMVSLGFIGLVVLALIAGLVLTLRNVNQELELSRLKANIVSQISHELKTPLALIRMYGETLLLGRVAEEEKKTECYRIITRESERLTQLIDNVLDFSAIEAHRKTYRFLSGDLSQVVREVLEVYGPQLADRGFRLNVQLAPELPDLDLDEGAITQALINLLDNAVKYSGNRREIDFRLYPKGDRILLEVADRGIGIHRRCQKKIFDLFYRAPETYQMGIRGNGLGLSLVKHIVEAHGGVVSVKSELGKGTTFSLSFPAKWGVNLGQGIRLKAEGSILKAESSKLMRI